MGTTGDVPLQCSNVCVCDAVFVEVRGLAAVLFSR